MRKNKLDNKTIRIDKRFSVILALALFTIATLVSGSTATTMVYAHTKAYEAGIASGGKGSNPYPPGSKDAIHYNVGVQDASKGSTGSTGGTTGGQKQGQTNPDQTIPNTPPPVKTVKTSKSSSGGCGSGNYSNTCPPIGCVASSTTGCPPCVGATPSTLCPPPPPPITIPSNCKLIDNGSKVVCSDKDGKGGRSTTVVKYIGGGYTGGLVQTSGIVMLPSTATDFANNDPKTLTLDFVNPTGPDSIGNYWVKGEVVNNGNSTVQNLKITAHWFDAVDKIIGVTFGYTDKLNTNLNSGDRSTFSIMADGHNDLIGIPKFVELSYDWQ
jgi:hypothetical protein